MSEAPAGRASRDCPLCGGSQHRLLLERDGWPIAACAACGMVFVPVALSYGEQAAAFDWVDTSAAEAARRRRQRGPLRRGLSRLSRRIKADRQQRLLGQVLRYRQGGQLLDVGCGDGQALDACAPRFQVSGIEISERLAEVCRMRVPSSTIVVAPFTTAPLPPAAYQVVLMISYLEHEWHPLDALRAAAQALAPDGLLLVKVPNHACWPRHAFGPGWCGYRLPDHCNYFTPATLADAVRRAGLVPLAQRLADRWPLSDNMWLAATPPPA